MDALGSRSVRIKLNIISSGATLLTPATHELLKGNKGESKLSAKVCLYTDKSCNETRMSCECSKTIILSYKGRYSYRFRDTVTGYVMVRATNPDTDEAAEMQDFNVCFEL